MIEMRRQWQIPGTTTALAFTDSSAVTASAFGTAAHEDILLRLSATQPCCIAFGTTPTATTSDMYIPAGEHELIRITGGHKIAAIRATTENGTLYITQMDE